MHTGRLNLCQQEILCKTGHDREGQSVTASNDEFKTAVIAAVEEDNQVSTRIYSRYTPSKYNNLQKHPYTLK